MDAAYIATKRDVAPGPYVLISVVDNGTGMSDDILKFVFEPFCTTKTKGNRTRLGSRQVYGFVKQSGGHLYLYSERRARGEYVPTAVVPRPLRK